MSVSYEKASSMIKGIGRVSDDVVALACKLFESNAVSLVPNKFGLSGDVVAYHLELDATRLERAQLAKCRCALLGDSMPLSNGVILGAEQRDLRCSQHPCKYAVCPVALAACFEACHQADEHAEIPLYSKYCREHRRAQLEAESFRSKWSSRLKDSDTTLNLLLSEQENDFAGALVLEDESYYQEFVDDLVHVLSVMGKIKQGAVTKSHLVQYLSNIDARSMRFKSGSESLPTRQLLIFDRLREFVETELPINLEYPYNETSKAFMIEQLGKIVDERYVLVVGTSEEVSSFCSLDGRFLHTFDQNRLNLMAMDMDSVYDLYVSYLDKDVRSLIADSGRFAREFKGYVGFNRDTLPFRGREMADFLAKHANSLRRPELPHSRYQSSSLEEMLDSIVGLQQVKDTIRQLERYAMFKKRAQADGREIPAASLHMLFTGNPGTGKTMMASIISTMLYKIGIIRQNKFHEVTAKDLIAAYVGQTDKRTHNEIEKALDGILFIDEAYALTEGISGEDGYGSESIAELVKSMDMYKDRLIVIFAGYEREMADFLETNPGLNSRIGYKFRFQDYSTDELLQIFEGAATKAGFECEEGLLDVELRELFAYHRRFKNFGNGRFVMEVLHRMIVKHAAAVSKGGIGEADRYVLRSVDVPTRQEINDITNWEQTGADDLLEPLVGMGDLKQKVRELERVVEFYEQGRKAGLKLPDINLHMTFTGNPGTGKTTIARIIGKILYNVGAISTDKFIEVEATDLARWQPRAGQTSVDRYIRDAMGGVLFVDEAYAITYQGHGQEIVATLVKAMEDHKGEIVVMFAGYRDQMREFIALNPGLASRIGYTFDFEDYKPDELQEIFELKMDHAGFSLAEDAKKASRAVFKYFHSVKDFGNGRFVDKLVQEVIARHAANVTEETLTQIVAEDVPSTKDLCKVVSMPVYTPSDVSADEAQRRIAIHEMGHATCSLALTGHTDISLVTIEQEGNGALGYVEYKTGGQPLPTSQHLRDRLCTLMGGIAAEDLLLGSFSAGGSDDLRQATNIASLYVGRFGMSGVGFVQYVGEQAVARGGVVDVSVLPEEVRSAMSDLLKEAFDHAKDTVAANKNAFDTMVDVLVREGTISGERITDTWKSLTGGDES
ncbi:MAG: AAA family ATPase [Atopobiaceae bacterium]|nr:AAA family ATPase [Atopobiaceae bacterium]